MFCKKCGNQLLEDDVFCQMCGNNVINSNENNNEGNRLTELQEYDNTKSKISVYSKIQAFFSNIVCCVAQMKPLHIKISVVAIVLIIAGCIIGSNLIKNASSFVFKYDFGKENYTKAFDDYKMQLKEKNSDTKYYQGQIIIYFENEANKIKNNYVNNKTKLDCTSEILIKCLLKRYQLRTPIDHSFKRC